MVPTHRICAPRRYSCAGRAIANRQIHLVGRGEGGPLSRSSETWAAHHRMEGRRHSGADGAGTDHESGRATMSWQTTVWGEHYIAWQSPEIPDVARAPGSARTPAEFATAKRGDKPADKFKGAACQGAPNCPESTVDHRCKAGCVPQSGSSLPAALREPLRRKAVS
jgi:hypothetical protein